MPKRLRAPSLPRPRVLADERFLQALLDPRTQLVYVQGGPCRVTAEWWVQRRTISEHLCYLITDGVCEGSAAGRALRLEPGSFAWVMPGAVHEFRIPEGGKPFSMVHFKIGVLQGGRPLRPARSVVSIGQALELQPIALELARAAAASARFGQLRMRAAMLVLLGRGLALEIERGQGGHALSPRQRQIIAAHVARDPSARHAPGDLAALLRLSPDYFTRAFRATYGIPPRTWLVRERMAIAAKRLALAQSRIAEIANELGYRDVFLFSRQFKHVFGIGPRAYRREPHVA